MEIATKSRRKFKISKNVGNFFPIKIQFWTIWTRKKNWHLGTLLQLLGGEKWVKLRGFTRKLRFGLCRGNYITTKPWYKPKRAQKWLISSSILAQAKIPNFGPIDLCFMANMGYLGVGSWFLTYLVTFENVFYLYSVYSDRWDIKGTYNYPKNTHNYPGYGYISKFYPSLDTPGYPLSIEVCLDPRLGFPVFRPFCNIVCFRALFYVVKKNHPI